MSVQLLRDVLKDMGRILTWGVLDKDDEPEIGESPEPLSMTIAVCAVSTLSFLVVFAIWYWG